jgi:hexosaminidase
MDLIQSAAKSHNLDIIPLIQTFGHMEWLLKLREFELYRDDLTSPMVITPCLNTTYILLEGNYLSSHYSSNPLSFRFFQDLLQQTLDMHPNSNIIHIGCDEVVLTNTHPLCRDAFADIPTRYIE